MRSKSVIGKSANFEDMDSDEERKRLKEEQEAEEEELADEVLESFKAGAKHQENMKAFVNNYGIRLKVPGYYIYDVKINPKNHEQLLQIVQYVVPKDDESTVITHIDDQEPVSQSMKEAFNDDIYSGTFSIRLLESIDNAVTVVREVPLRNTTKPFLAFSPCGSYFLVYRKKQNKINFFKLEEDDGINVLLDRLESDDSGDHEIAGEPVLKGNRRIEWSSDSQFVICYGLEKLSVINLIEGDEAYGQIIFTYNMT